MKPFKDDIEKLALANSYFRHVVYTGKHSQVVLMSLKPQEEIGMEVHETVDQFFRIEKGQAKFVVDGVEYEAEDGDAVVIPAGSQHNVINPSFNEELKLYTIYSPPNHPDGTINETKADAEEYEKAKEQQH